MRVIKALVARYLHTDEVWFFISFGLAAQFHFCHHQSFIIAIEFIYLEGMVATLHQIATLVDDTSLAKLQEMLRSSIVISFSNS